MNFHKLDVFCKIVELGSVTEAAHQLHVTQPVVSAHVRDLEREFEARLFNVDRRRMVPTEVGKAVYQYALKIRHATVDIHRYTQAWQAGEAGAVVVSASHGPAGYLLPELFAQFKQSNPLAELGLAVMASPEVFDGVLSGDYDFGVITGDEVPTELHMEVLAQERLCFITTPDDPLAAASRVPAAELANALYVFPFFPRTQAWLRRCMRDLGILSPRISMTLGSWEAVKHAVMARAGLAVVYRSCVVTELAAGKLAEVNVLGNSLTQPIGLVRHPQKEFTPLQERFYSHLRTQM